MWNSFRRNFDGVRFTLTLAISSVYCTAVLLMGLVS